MPHTSSAKKNLRKAEKNRIRNRAAKRSLKTYIKRFLTAAEAPATEVAALQTEFNLVSKKIDQTAAKGVIHKNMAARKKSQLARMLYKKKTAPTPAAKPTT
jgi:small subunit ribosomal protein S20